jgi:hypothetical protein
MVKTRSKVVAKFIAHVRAECKRLKVKFRFSKYRKVNCGDGALCGGFFVTSPRTLAVATGKRTQSQWLALLVHEFNHMLQWHENSRFWNSESDKFLDWLSGKYNNWDKKQLAYHYRKARDVEWDCERRSLKMVKEWGLPLDTKTYARQANTYVGSYAVMMKKRKWITKPLYTNPRVANHMPANRILSRKELAHPPKKFVAACLKLCY